MRIGRRVPVVLASAIAVILVGGVAAAVTSHPATAKACVTSHGALRLKVGGTCATGQTEITLGSQGPNGATGARGPRGVTGARGRKGDTGPAGTAQRINFNQVTPEATTVTHALATAGPVTLIASCQGTALTTTSLVLSLTGGTDPLSFTATDVSSDNGAVVVVAVEHGTTVSLGTTALPTDTTVDSRSDVVTIVVSAASGKEVTGTLDVELSVAADTSACTVNGTLASA